MTKTTDHHTSQALFFSAIAAICFFFLILQGEDEARGEMRAGEHLRLLGRAIILYIC